MLERALRDNFKYSLHQMVASALSITQASEAGTVYHLDEIAALREVARERSLAVFTWTARALPMHRRPRRRLVWPQRTPASTPRCATTLRDPGGGQPQRRLDCRPTAQQARPHSPATRASTRWPKRFGCYGEYVERSDEIRLALNCAQREVDRSSVALVNVKTDDRARATTVTFARHAT